MKVRANLLGDDGGLSAEDTAMMDADRRSTPDTEAAAVQEAPAPVAEPAAAPVAAPKQAAPEAPVEAKDGDEAAPADADKAKGDPDVPLRAERHKVRELEKTLQAANEEKSKLLGRFEMLAAMAQQQPKPGEQPAAEPEPIEVPDFETDPAGHLKASLELQRRQLEQIEQYRAQQQEAQKAQEAQNNVQRLIQITADHEAAYRKDNPDYNKAAQHLYEGRDMELQAMGVTDPAQRFALIRQDIAAIAAQALEQRVNVAERIMQIASARGYRAEPSPLTSAAPAPAAAAPAAPAQPTAAERIQTVAKGQEVSLSLSSAPGGAQPKAMTAMDIANMDDDAFAEFAKSHDWKKVMEGLPKG